MIIIQSGLLIQTANNPLKSWIQMSTNKLSLHMRKGYMSTDILEIDELIFVRFLQGESLCYCRRFITRQFYKCNNMNCKALYNAYKQYFSNRKLLRQHRWFTPRSQVRILTGYLFKRLSYNNFYSDTDNSNLSHTLHNIPNIEHIFQHAPQICTCHCIIHSPYTQHDIHSPRYTFIQKMANKRQAFNSEIQNCTSYVCIFCKTHIPPSTQNNMTYIQLEVYYRRQTQNNYILLIDQATTNTFQTDNIQKIYIWNTLEFIHTEGNAVWSDEDEYDR